ncbi:MAG TPA: caspase family protein, partial [Chloroflexota bacterium]|nr:caspase family protein [Chloroflexota bacterium]
MPRKVAIVIGVRRAAGFQELPGALAGARDFAAWARQDGFEVISFVDEGDQPVTRSAIFAAIKALVERQDVEQLFLYFAGHGMATGIDDDYWILSAGVQDPSEVINVGSSLKLAAQSQIPHIAVFADACRTLATARHIGIAEGTSSIFPNRGLAEQPVELDLFYGSRTAGPALEITGDPGRVEAHGVFTRVLVEALTGVDRSAARRDPATGEMVIHAASLAQYLRRRVPEATSALPVPAPQIPDCRPTSALPRRIASLGQPTRARLSVEARLPTGAVADGASLAILLNDPTQNPPWIELRRSAAPRFSEQLPVLGTYGVSATLADHTQTPASPKPIEYLTGDTESIVTLQPSAAGQGPTPPAILPPLGPRRGGGRRGGRRPGGGRSGGRAPAQAPPPPPPETPSLTATFLVDEHGRKEQVAPAAGVFFVTTEDVLTGRVASELQELGQGESPQPVGTLAADPEAEGWVQRVTEHEGRGHFETRSGLTVAGSPILAAFVAGGHEGLFQEDGYWHLRGHDL